MVVHMAARILILMICSVATLMLAGTPQPKEQGDMSTVRVRYMVNQLDPAVDFYTKYLGFKVKQEARVRAQNRPCGPLRSLAHLHNS